MFITKITSAVMTLAFFVVGCIYAQPAHVAPDVTAQMELLGNPSKARYHDGADVYARNVWDLAAYKGRLYIGAGNSANVGPAANSGPVPIWSYDPASSEFRREFTVDDEQVDVFYTFEDGRLYVPGHDPRESWELGNFYRRELDGTWHKYRNIPNGIHNFAMAWFSGELFAGLGTEKDPGIVVVSKDNGATWSEAGAIGWFRIHSFLHCGGHLYATAIIPPRAVAGGSSAGSAARWLTEKERSEFVFVGEYDGRGKFTERADLNPVTLFPDTDLLPLPPGPVAGAYKLGRYVPPQMKIVRPVSLHRKAAFIGAYNHNDMQSRPFGLYVADSLKPGSVKVRRVTLPALSRPWDLIVRDGVAYALLESAEQKGCTVRVLASKDLVKWAELFHFHSAAFARSFEILDGSFYFGLGSEIFDPRNWTQDELAPETGDILRVAADKLDLRAGKAN